jgi:hypothetical protein
MIYDQPSVPVDSQVAVMMVGVRGAQCGKILSTNPIGEFVSVNRRVFTMLQRSVMLLPFIPSLSHVWLCQTGFHWSRCVRYRPSTVLLRS